MYIGVDYYPEQWPATQWDKDIQLMKTLGINVVRMAEFGWSLMEPEEGSYDFSLFDDVMDRFDEAGIAVVLGTPTATPPAWMVEAYPDILPVDKSGRTVSFGARRHYTVNSRTYQEKTRQIVEAMGRHFRHHPALIGWQVDNEYGHEASDRSYGEEDARAFREWLERKYGTLENMNKRWGTVFWSQVYTSWEQIPVPLPVYQEHNPSLLLDFDRFCADAYDFYNQLQVNALRTWIPDSQFITHNFVYSGLALDQKKMAESLDFISFDNYPVWGGLAEPIPPAAIARQLDLCRGTKQGTGYWVMEQLSGAQGWSQIGYLPRPGHLKLWTYQAISRGAEAIVYFRWRAARFGTEQFCHGILDHDGVPRRKFDETKEVIESLETVGDRWIAAEVTADIGFYHDPENEWAWKIQPQSDQFDYAQEALRFYEPAFAWNVPVDMIREDADISRYRLIIVPLYFLTKPGFQEKLEYYVRSGGTVVFTYRTGVKDADNIVTEKTLPGSLAALVGAEIHEYESIRENNSAVIEGVKGAVAGEKAEAHVWCDYLVPDTAETLAVYRDGWVDERAAITKHSVGEGKVYYIGCGVNTDFLYTLYRDMFEDAGVSVMETPKNVEMVRREGKSEDFISIMNHDTEKAGEITLPPGTWTEPATGEYFQERMVLPALGSMLLVQHREN
ncbi:beta-galactosidase [Salibacterium lacus]|uniref:Beta-galactosidase n=1 Tax=Salibacterium lacus TaxID=1898109 RepID=A0ABW5T4U6_9BACI